MTGMPPPDIDSSQRRRRPEPLFLDIPEVIFRKTPELVADMPEHLNPLAHLSGDGSNRYRLLLYGCSLTTQYGAELAEHLQCLIPVDVWMCGLCGRTAAELKRMADHPVIEDCADRVGKGINVILAEYAPFDLVLILAGTNDLGMEYEPHHVVDNVKMLHQMCHERGVPTIALSLPPNRGCEQSSEYQEKWLSVNKALSVWGTDTACSSTLLFVDTGALVPLDKAGLFYDIDRLHFSIVGAERLGSALAPLIAPLLSESAKAKSP